MLKDNETKIIELTEQNQSLQKAINAKNEALQNLQENISIKNGDVENHGKITSKNTKKGAVEKKEENLNNILLKLQNIKRSIKTTEMLRKEPDLINKISIIKKSIAMAKTKAVLIQNASLQEKVANYELEIDTLKQKLR